MSSMNLKRAIYSSAGAALLFSLNAGADNHQQQNQQQQGRQCRLIETPETPPCVSSCKVKEHVTTYQWQQSGTITKEVEVKTRCRVAKDASDANRHSDSYPVGKMEGCDAGATQQITQTSCGASSVKSAPLSLCINQKMDGTTTGTLEKKEYFTYELQRRGGDVKVIKHDCAQESATAHDFFEEFIDKYDISLDEAVNALEAQLKKNGPMTIKKECKGAATKSSAQTAQQTSQTSRTCKAAK